MGRPPWVLAEKVVSSSPGQASDTELQVLALGHESAREPGVVCVQTVKGS